MLVYFTCCVTVFTVKLKIGLIARLFSGLKFILLLLISINVSVHATMLKSAIFPHRPPRRDIIRCCGFYGTKFLQWQRTLVPFRVYAAFRPYSYRPDISCPRCTGTQFHTLSNLPCWRNCNNPWRRYIHHRRRVYASCHVQPNPVTSKQLHA